jgi:DNA polymerase III epsilon subunit-like protein
MDPVTSHASIMSTSAPVGHFPPTQEVIVASTVFKSSHPSGARRRELLRNMMNGREPLAILDPSLSPLYPEDGLALLEYCVLPAHVMQAYPFVTEPLSLDQLQGKQRCAKCQKLPRYIGKSLVPPRKDTDMLYCRFHPGYKLNKLWTCCQQHVSTPACSGSKQHSVQNLTESELRALQFHTTPQHATKDARLVIAMDCEMGTAANGDNELIRVSVIDFFTGAVLLDKLVFPLVPMAHYNTKYSGVSRSDMETARRKNQCLRGTTAARDAVMRFIGRQTIVIGHAVHNDLSSLRCIHHRIIDTHVLEDKFDRMQKARWEEVEASMVGLERTQEEIDEERKIHFLPLPDRCGALSLKGASLRRLGRHIQTAHGHCSREDAIASRDVAMWHALNPRLLEYLW